MGGMQGSQQQNDPLKNIMLAQAMAGKRAKLTGKKSPQQIMMEAMQPQP